MHLAVHDAIAGVDFEDFCDEVFFGEGVLVFGEF